MREARLENWSIVEMIVPHPQKRIRCLAGEVYEHQNHKDGTRVITSMIMHGEEDTVITLNTKYKLGKVCNSYKNWYKEKHNKDLNESNPFHEN